MHSVPALANPALNRLLGCGRRLFPPAHSRRLRSPGPLCSGRRLQPPRGPIGAERKAGEASVSDTVQYRMKALAGLQPVLHSKFILAVTDRCMGNPPDAALNASVWVAGLGCSGRASKSRGSAEWASAAVCAQARQGTLFSLPAGPANSFSQAGAPRPATHDIRDIRAQWKARGKVRKTAAGNR